jgi:hypothetical protein
MSDKKKGGIWFVIVPVLLIAGLAASKFISSNKDSQDENPKGTIVVSTTDGGSLSPVSKGQKPNIDSEMKHISYPPKLAFITIDHARLFNDMDGGSERNYTVRFKDSVYHLARKNGFLFCRFKNSLQEPDSAWIMQSALAATIDDVDKMYQHNIVVPAKPSAEPSQNKIVKPAPQTNGLNQNVVYAIVDVTKDIEEGKRLEAVQKRSDSISKGLLPPR